MDIFLYISIPIFSLLLLIMILYFMKIRFHLYASNNIVVFKFGIFKIIDTSKKKSKSKQVKQNEFGEDYIKFKKIIYIIKGVITDKNDDLILAIRHLKKTVRIKNISIAVDYGFSDSAITGISSGIIWVVVSFVTSFLYKYIDLKKYLNISITPHYDESQFKYKINFTGYVSIKNLIKFLKHIKRLSNTLKRSN